MFTIFTCSRIREHLIIMDMQEPEIIYAAVGNIREQMGLKATVEPNPKNANTLRIRIGFEDNDLCFNIETRKDLREHQLPTIEDIARQKDPFMLVAQYLGPGIKAELRKRNIAYLEVNGNLFIRHKGACILIDANKPIDLARETGNRAFTKTGLKVVYLYLTDEAWLNQTHRAIARQTNTGLGNINNVNSGLEKEGFLFQIKRGEKQLQNKKELLERWLKAYFEQLQPTLRIGRFRFLHDHDFANWKELVLDKDTWWGGEPAAAILTNYLQPGELTLYTNRSRNELMREYKLIPDQKGILTALTPFWNVENTIPGHETVHPLLVYADLMNTSYSRCHETARIIWDKYLENEF